MVQMGDILLGMLCVCLRGKMACVREKLTGGKEGVLKAREMTCFQQQDLQS